MTLDQHHIHQEVRSMSNKHAAQWGKGSQARVIIPAPRTQPTTEQIEQQLDKIVGDAIAHGATLAHGQAGARLLVYSTEHGSYGVNATAGFLVAGPIGALVGLAATSKSQVVRVSVYATRNGTILAQNV